MSVTKTLELHAQFDAKERREREVAVAYEAGGLAYHAAIKLIDGEPSKEAAARSAFETANPYKMVSYGDEGHERPAWFRGFNDAMAALYGVREPKWKQMGDPRPEELNGRSPITNDRIASYEEAVQCAERLTERQHATYWAEDRGAHVSPRYAVIRAFVIGEPVSYGFNGDSYPAGRIVAMSKTAPVGTGVGPRIITVQDHNGRRRKFWRRGLSGSWKHEKTWSLQHGWHSDRNPSF